MSSTIQTEPKLEEPRRGDEGSNHPVPEEEPRPTRTLAQQWYDEFVHNIPSDDDMSNAPTGLSEDEEDSIREMEPDILEMAGGTVEGNDPICSCS